MREVYRPATPLLLLFYFLIIYLFIHKIQWAIFKLLCNFPKLIISLSNLKMSFLLFFLCHMGEVTQCQLPQLVGKICSVFSFIR